MELSAENTATKTKEINDPRKINAFKQLFGNIGNFSAESFVNNY